MADISKQSDGPTPSDPSAFDVTTLPDYDQDFISEEDILAFANALAAPETSPSQDDLLASHASKGTFVTALNDWRPVRQRVKKRKAPSRGKDETREGNLYAIVKWPLLSFVLGWIIFLGISYTITRFYIYLYEHWITWRGRREKLRKSLSSQQTYEDWVRAATKLDGYLNNDRWKTVEDNAYYDSKTVKKVRNTMRKLREEAEIDEKSGTQKPEGHRPVDDLRALVESSVRDNFAGFENPRLYSETYYGCKSLQQSFVNEAETSLSFLQKSTQLNSEDKYALWKHVQMNFGRTALCLSGGATFSFYHFGVAKALLDANLIPQVITGTSGGALVAALLATRTDDELKQLLIPALANRITACHDSVWVWTRRWWKTGARFDSVDWAKRCSWFTRGSMTFKEAYERTGRILNISCVPSDPHSPTILANYLTSPDCVIWSAVLASAAVPGILNPIVLMKKNRNGSLEPYSFGHKWKDGSLRTDIPLRALNLHFNVNFTIVSQVNPHINLFFFSSRGTVGRPVTHRKGRGWRGGFLGSAVEQYLKLDLTKWLRVLRDLELLPRPLGQDWSQLWLQRFSGTITIWPKSIPSDFWHILSDPTPQRLARMIHTGQLSTWPKLLFIANRMKLEKIIDEGRRNTKSSRPGLSGVLSEDEFKAKLRKSENGSSLRRQLESSGSESEELDLRSSKTVPANTASKRRSAPQTPKSPPPADNLKLSDRVKNWFGTGDRSTHKRTRSATNLLSPSYATRYSARSSGPPPVYSADSARRSSTLLEMARQSSIFFDDTDFDADMTEGERIRRQRNSEFRPMISDAEANFSADNKSLEGESDAAALRDSDLDSVNEQLRRETTGPTVVG